MPLNPASLPSKIWGNFSFLSSFWLLSSVSRSFHPSLPPFSLHSFLPSLSLLWDTSVPMSQVYTSKVLTERWSVVIYIRVAGCHLHFPVICMKMKQVCSCPVAVTSPSWICLLISLCFLLGRLLSLDSEKCPERTLLQCWWECNLVQPL